MRLKRASQLLEGHAGTVAEVAYRVGFKSVSHFSRRFNERYGVRPSEWDGNKE
jgi:transcriptional regulator GlxA family with amidase domain